MIVLGLSAVGAARSAGGVLRMTLLPAAVLMASGRCSLRGLWSRCTTEWGPCGRPDIGSEA